jgi:hypothetical protein
MKTNEEIKLEIVHYIEQTKFNYSGIDAMLIGDVAIIVEKLLNEIAIRDLSPIDNVTTSVLKSSLDAVGINLECNVVDNIIDIVELIEEKGENVSIKDLHELEVLWSKSNF